MVRIYFDVKVCQLSSEMSTYHDVVQIFTHTVLCAVIAVLPLQHAQAAGCSNAISHLLAEYLDRIGEFQGKSNLCGPRAANMFHLPIISTSAWPLEGKNICTEMQENTWASLRG